jgi:phage shock protein A
MAFLGDIFGRMGRVVRGQANAGVDVIEDATFEATVRQTVADMKTELNKVVRASAMAMSNYNSLEGEYQKYLRQSEEWKQRARRAEAEAAAARLLASSRQLQTYAHSNDRAGRLQAVTNSTSWRLTEPLRRLNALRKAAQERRQQRTPAATAQLGAAAIDVEETSAEPTAVPPRARGLVR